jgi:Leucine-rich repeat (LRR) protein
LTKLVLSWNQLVALPDSIAALTALKTLSLHNNKLVTLPDSIAALTALKRLILSNNPLAKPQSSAVEAWLTALRAGSCTMVMPNGW